MGAVLSMECERARTRASLALDGELSQVEQALLRAHLGRCAACAEFECDVYVLTQEIRTAPLERSATAGLPRRRRSTGRRILQLGTAAAAVAVAAALGSMAGSLSSRSSSHRAAVPQVVRVASLSTIATARPGTRLQQPVAL